MNGGSAFLLNSPNRLASTGLFLYHYVKPPTEYSENQNYLIKIVGKIGGKMEHPMNRFGGQPGFVYNLLT